MRGYPDWAAASFPWFEQRFEIGERVACRGRRNVLGGRGADAGVVDVTRVFVVVAVNAQQLPIAAVGRIVTVVVVAVMHRQLLQVGAGELARATAADPRIHLQRPLAIALVALFGTAPRFGDDTVQLGVVGDARGHCDDL